MISTASRFICRNGAARVRLKDVHQHSRARVTFTLHIPLSLANVYICLCIVCAIRAWLLLRNRAIAILLVLSLAKSEDARRRCRFLHAMANGIYWNGCADRTTNAIKPANCTQNACHTFGHMGNSNFRNDGRKRSFATPHTRNSRSSTMSCLGSAPFRLSSQLSLTVGKSPRFNELRVRVSLQGSRHVNRRAEHHKHAQTQHHTVSRARATEPKQCVTN